MDAGGNEENRMKTACSVEPHYSLWTFRSTAQTSIDRVHKSTSISSKFLVVVSFEICKCFVHHTSVQV